MADNYIEKQREQYEARKAAWMQSRKQRPAKPKSDVPTIASEGRRVFVTGGSAGIGREIVKTFAQAGYRVAFCDIEVEQGNRTAAETGARFFPTDVSDAKALEKVVSSLLTTWGDIDVIINNVGISHFSPITETSVEAFDHILAVNLRPVFITARLLAIHRQALPQPNPYGRIVNICSTRHQMSEPGCEGYAASKGGILSLTHALALSLSPWHITVNSISPGWIETGEYTRLRPEDHHQHPSRRVGKPSDIARACLFFCEEGNDFINGENITIDGGMTKKMIYVE